MYETYRMLGELREAELLREAQRLQIGVTTRPRAARPSIPNRSETVLQSIAGRLRRPAPSLGAIKNTVERERDGQRHGAGAGR